MFGKSFFNLLSLSTLVPVANIVEPKLLNFFTKELPIPPVAPVIKTFFIV